MRRILHSFLWWGMALAASAGCGGPAHEYDAVVTGTVTIEGELAKSGTVIFHPVAKDGLFAIGQIFPDGSYSLRTGQGDLTKVDGGTVKPGDYIVTVAISAPSAAGHVVADGGPPVPGPSLIAKKYALKETSDLHRTVKPGPNIFVFQLERAEMEPDSAEADGAPGEVGEQVGAEKSTSTSESAEQSTTPATDASPALESEPAAAPNGASPEPAGTNAKPIGQSAEAGEQ